MIPKVIRLPVHLENQLDPNDLPENENEEMDYPGMTKLDKFFDFNANPNLQIT